MKEGRDRYLQMGGGKHGIIGEKWKNGDIIAGEFHINAAKKLPFPDNSIQAIFTEQFFEHLSPEEGLYFLKESYRVLKPGGILRQSTPDLEKMISIYNDQSEFIALSEVVDRHNRNHRNNHNNSNYTLSDGCQWINDMFRLWGHKFIYDKNSVKSITLMAGFRECRYAEFGKSELHYLNNLERHADEEWMKYAFVMVYEAIK